MPDVSLNGIEFEIKGSTDKASDSISKLINQLGSLKSSIGKTGNVGKFTDSMKQIDKSAKSANKSMGKLTSAVLRVGFYRLIRSAIKSVGDAFKEGLTNAYQFSKLTGGELASSLDLIATKSLTMKNQMGAAFGGLITAITPIVIQLIKIVNAVAAAITRLIAIISGRSTWLRAKDVWTEWGESASGAGKAAKEALKYLAPFDELNRLPDERDRSGGSGQKIPDYSEMFEEVPTSVGAGLLDTLTEAFKNLGNWFKGKDWENVGEQAFATLKSLFSDTDKASELVSAFFNTLGAAFGAAQKFVWGFLKGAVDDFFQAFKDNIKDYNGDNKIGIVDILTSFYKTTNGSLLDWIWNNIAKPFWDGLKSTLFKKKEDAIDLGDLEIKIDLKSGIKNIGNWFKKNVLTPIVNKINEFIGNYPVIAKLLGLKEGADFLSDTGSSSYKPMTSATSAIKTELNNSSTVGINVEADVTNIKDSVPQRKKILGDVAAKLTSLNDGVPIGKKVVNGVKALFTTTQDKTTAAQKTLPVNAKYTSSTDALTAAQKTLSSTANYTASKDGLTAAQKTIGTTSKYTSASDALTAAQKTVGTKANFNSSADSLTVAQKKFNTSANFNSITDSLTAAQKKFGVVANFNSRTDSLTDANKSFNSKANFNTRSDSLTDANKTFDSKANFNKYSIDSKGTLKTGYGVWSYATAWFDDYEPYFDETPTIDVIANITGTTVDENGFSGTTGKFAKGGSYYGGAWHDIPQAASGGRFHGSLVWAGENGPEVLGHAGGRTEILNQSQLASTMYAAVTSALSGIQMRVTGMGAATTGGDESMSEEMMYRAMLRALNDSDVFPEELDLDGEAVWRRMVQRNRQNTRMTGVNAMMTA